MLPGKSDLGWGDRIGGTMISIVISAIVIVFSLPIFTATALFGMVIYLLAFAQLMPLIRSDDRTRGPLKRGGGLFAPYVAGFTFAMPPSMRQGRICLAASAASGSSVSRGWRHRPFCTGRHRDRYCPAAVFVPGRARHPQRRFRLRQRHCPDQAPIPAKPPA